MIYDNLVKNKKNIFKVKNKVLYHFVNGPYVEIKGNAEENYLVKFIDKKSNKIIYETQIKNNMWTRCSVQYFVDWRIEVWKDTELFFEHEYNAKGKRIFVAMDSKALGDTLAWVPMVDEFRKKNKCEMILSTFHNYLFEDQYKEIEFVNPGTTVNNLYGMFALGLFYNEDGSINFFKNPNNFREQPLQKMASDILGLEPTEVKPKLPIKDIQKDDKLITIAIHGTAQPKYWNNPHGWQDVVDWLNNRGYTVKLLSREDDNYMGNKHPKGIIKHPVGTLESVMDELRKSKAFIGIGSGLSWLSWGLGTKTVLISGFSYEWAEMEDCVRIGAPQGKCSGCFNRLKLNAGDWNWCPDHKDTPRQFECTKSITSEMVIKELEKFL
jgi:autotransporter strand-loop-strand O-heptosyltransferase